MPKIIPVATFDCVVFGATGDLTLRKLLPPSTTGSATARCRPSAAVIAAARPN